MMAKLNWALTVLLVASIAILLWVRRNYGEPNIQVEILPNMAHSPAYASFTPNPVLPDGKTLQLPVPGTLPRGPQPLDLGTTPAETMHAAEQLKNPLDPAKAKVRGAVVYQNFCTPCHGGSMRGDGMVPQHGFPAPPSLLSAHSVGLSEGQMFHILTYGQNKMPSYAVQLSVDDRWSVIAYVKSSQPAATAPAATPAAATVPTGGIAK
ncbi:MAG: cytochrome c [Bryobacterales bacterium]|nr:cytochrome c [Bryobacterales bacterium]